VLSPTLKYLATRTVERNNYVVNDMKNNTAMNACVECEKTSVGPESIRDMEFNVVRAEADQTQNQSLKIVAKSGAIFQVLILLT